MQKNKNRYSKYIELKELNVSDVSKEYVEWLNDFETVKYTEQRYKKNSRKDIENYVKNIKLSKISFLYGIYLKNNNRDLHVGNIKLGPINHYHKYAYISYFIGNKNYLNKGYGKLLIKNIAKLAKKKFILKKIIAGTYSNNIASRKILEFNKFKLEGRIKKQFKFKNKYVDHLIYGKLI